MHINSYSGVLAFYDEYSRESMCVRVYAQHTLRWHMQMHTHTHTHTDADQHDIVYIVLKIVLLMHGMNRFKLTRQI